MAIGSLMGGSTSLESYYRGKSSGGGGSYRGGGGKESSSSSYCIPKEGSSAEAFRRHFDRVINYDSPAYIEQCREWQIARAFYLTHQWLELDRSQSDPRRAVRFTDPTDKKLKIPRPTTNEILPIVDNETAKLNRRRSAAYVRPMSMQVGTGGAMGGQVANDVMEWHLETIAWPKKRRTATFRDVLYGTAYYWSYLDQNYMDSVRLGITSARRCTKPGCDLILADQSLPAEDFQSSGMMGMVDRYSTRTKYDRESNELISSYKATKCLKCGESLREYIPVGDELNREDLFGRPLFTLHPRNQPDIEIPSPFDMFPHNEGIGYDFPEDVKEWYRCTPRSIDHWIAAHYPDLVGEVDPDDIDFIATKHPWIGGYGASPSYGSYGASRSIWRNHALVCTGIVEPCMKYPRGRYVEMAGNTLLRDEDLYRESKHRPGVVIPLVQVTCSRFFTQDGQLQGMGIVKPLVSPQNRINMTWAQVIDHRQRNGVSGVLASDGMKLTAGWVDGFAGRVLRWSPDPGYPSLTPEFIDTRMIDSAVYQELDRTIDRMQQIAGAQDVDLGKAPRNVSAATAIQLLQEQASGRRETREQELVDSHKFLYSHQLLLLSEFATEPRKYRTQAQNGKWEIKEFRGLDLAGHTDVIVEEQAGYDARAFEREAMTQAIQLKIITISTPYARREAAKALGISLKVTDEENTQINDCESKWYAFRNQMEIPRVDEFLDDHWIMYSVYGRFLKSPEGALLSKAYEWGKVSALIEGWPAKLAQAEQLAEYIQNLVLQASRDPMAAQVLQSFMMETGETPETIKLPPAMQDKILYTWGKLGVDITSPYVQFRAAHEAHRMLGEKKKMEAMAGPTFAAPGGAQTLAGTEPVLGSMPVPGAGEAAGGIPTGPGDHLGASDQGPVEGTLPA